MPGESLWGPTGGLHCLGFLSDRVSLVQGGTRMASVMRLYGGILEGGRSTHTTTPPVPFLGGQPRTCGQPQEQAILERCPGLSPWYQVGTFVTLFKNFGTGRSPANCGSLGQGEQQTCVYTGGTDLGLGWEGAGIGREGPQDTACPGCMVLGSHWHSCHIATTDFWNCPDDSGVQSKLSPLH